MSSLNNLARGYLGRAVAKAEALKQSGTFIVVDGAGSPVSAVRMDGCAPGALPIVRAKAFAAAVNGEPSARFAERMMKFSPVIFSSYEAVMREQPFPGGGGVLIERDGRHMGAIATGLGIGPFVKLPGVDPSELMVDGKPANLEDLIISYALGTGYSAQHGDDLKRWMDAYGAEPAGSLVGTGLDDVPPASRQKALDRAQMIADYALAEAKDGHPIAVVVVDGSGDVLCLDRMDHAPPMGVDIASATATASINFGVASGRIAELFPNAALRDRLLDLVPYDMLALPGGHLISARNQIAAAVGIWTFDPNEAEALAARTAEWAKPFFFGDKHD